MIGCSLARKLHSLENSGCEIMNRANSADDFWRQISLAEMSREQWESLCDGCARCCLHKLQDEDTGELAFTSVACDELDLNNGRCRHYAERQTRVPDCLVLSPDMDDEIYQWLPETCAYRLVWQGDDLPAWHPLLSGNRKSLRNAGVSVIGFAISERLVRDDDLEDYVIDLPAPLEPLAGTR